MPTLVSARQTLISLVKPVVDSLGIPVFYENRDTADLDKVGNHFIEVVVDFNTRDEADMKAMNHTTGALAFLMWSKRGSGVVTELDVIDTLDISFSRVVSNGVNLGVLTAGPTSAPPGWRRTEWLIPFSYYG